MKRGVLYHLFDTLPLQGAKQRIEDATGKRFADCTSAEISGHLQCADSTLSPRVYPPLPPRPPKDADRDTTRIWRFGWNCSDPATFFDIDCRVREADFDAFRVLNRLEFGVESPVGSFKNALEVTLTNDATVDLPLDARFLHSVWIASGHIKLGSFPLWDGLESIHDIALVAAFVFTLNTDTCTAEPIRLSDLSQEERAQWKVAEAARDDLLLNAVINANSWAVSPKAKNLGADLYAEPFMEADAHHPTSHVGQSSSVRLSGARFLVAISITCCRERRDFEPGAVVGAGRLYPHILFKADVPVKHVEASIQFDRPERTTHVDGQATCCKEHDVAEDKIGSAVFTDSNSGAHTVLPPLALANAPIPIWSSLFNYYLDQPYDALKAEVMHMVRPDRPKARESRGHIERRLPDHRSVATGPIRYVDAAVGIVKKSPFQGEFDNIHLAPRMAIVGVDAVGGGFGWDSFQATKLRTEKIAMAPICAHDCFHMHWRWSDEFDQPQTLGWIDDETPYRVAGAPLVPLNQQVDVWMRSPYQFTYHVSVRDRRSGVLQPWKPIIFCHHGGAYGLDATKWTLTLARVLVDTVDPTPEFRVRGTVGTPLKSRDSWALFYWRLRFDGKKTGGAWVAEERTAFHDLKAARTL